MGWLKDRNDYQIGLISGVIYMSVAGLAAAGFIGSCTYVYHLSMHDRIQGYEQKIEELEQKVKDCDKNNSTP
jgi:hypothetical protein